MSTRTIAAFVVALGAAGCTLLAGVDDIEYEASRTSPPPPSPSAPASAAPSPEAAPPASDPPTSTGGGTPTDAGAPPEAGADAGVVDEPPPPAEPPPDPPPPVGDVVCANADFAANDRRGPLALRVVTFPALPAAEARYAPRCMRIRAGQSVTFAGNFALYPLAPMGEGANASPIGPVAGGATASFAFPTKGRYGFGSAGAATLRGEIDVK